MEGEGQIINFGHFECRRRFSGSLSLGVCDAWIGLGFRKKHGLEGEGAYPGEFE